VAVASKLPIVDAVVTPVLPARIPAMEARLTLGGQSLTIACVHLVPPLGKHRQEDGLGATVAKNAEVRVKQAAWLVARYAARRGPLLVVGDFNETPGGKAMHVFTSAGFADACDAPTSRCGATFPGPALPLPAAFRIDHVLGRGVCFMRGAVVLKGGSDHYPVVGEGTPGPCAGT
jgi:endonuclease/exonuclease/phosphatase (EEP) superfamily protein YafD